MKNYDYIIRFRGTTSEKDENRNPIRFALVEFPPRKRIVFEDHYNSLYLQLPYFYLGIFYHKIDNKFFLDHRFWDFNSCYSRVLAYFRPKPMSSITDILAGVPFSGHYETGQVCFGPSENNLYEPHNSLRQLINTISKVYWSTSVSIGCLVDHQGNFISKFNWKGNQYDNFIDLINWFYGRETDIIYDVFSEQVFGPQPRLQGRFNAKNRI